ncbi:Glucose/ribitol dehydrogenase [Penicillium maclennaniae]|uniref:Glucose/ribitol dehydrogenase n=1 Tax=Penicillium maclennaniae TaxID=1343394 RepID=UPI0025425F08|nr:Glucose/ribitol dehydrogenase [Penicillium maclennaniae]KAJ5674976.1 Glucose/ribitol dehydrogenase [Penicillium maclennaniae]
MAPFPSPTPTWHSDSYPSISPTRPELSAQGKAVLVTGGGTGIGAETAMAFASAAASRIALLGRREKPLLATKASIEEKFPNVEVHVASTDVTDQSQVDVAFSNFASQKTIDILVSGAATIGPMGSVKDVDSARLLEAVQQNLEGALFVAQPFLRHASEHVVAIDINSSAAHVNFADGFAAEARGVKATGIEDHVSLPAHFCVWLASPEAQFLKSKFLWANWDIDELKANAKEIEGNTQFTNGLVGWPFLAVDWKATWNPDEGGRD